MNDRPELVRRRRARPEDRAFRRRLFGECHGARFAGIDPDLVDVLLDQQMAGQDMTYGARYPGAETDILERDGAPIGRIVVDRTVEAIVLVDIALLAEHQGRGLGTRLLHDLIDDAEAIGRAIRLSIDPANTGARRLYERLGFVEVDAGVMNLTMERRPTAE